MDALEVVPHKPQPAQTGEVGETGNIDEPVVLRVYIIEASARSRSQ